MPAKQKKAARKRGGSDGGEVEEICAEETVRERTMWREKRGRGVLRGRGVRREEKREANTERHERDREDVKTEIATEGAK